MFNVLFGRELPDTIGNIDVYFDNVYEDEWFEDERVKQIVRDIDKSEVSGTALISPFLGTRSVTELSGGAKGLILMLKADDLDRHINFCSFGNNCEDWLVKISEIKDMDVCTTNAFMYFKGKKFHFKCMNDGDDIYGWEDWIRKLGEYWEDYYEGET